MKKYNLILFVLLVLFSINLVSATWWDSNWGKRQEINITNVGSTTLSGFPAYINVTYDSDMQEDYDDLRFMNGSCTSGQSLQLAHEFDNYTSSNTYVWVKIPDLTAGVNSICMYYSNSGASSGENMTGAWNSNYVGVYHFNGDPSTDPLKDSTSNSNNGTASGFVSGDKGTDFLGNYWMFDDNNNFVTASLGALNVNYTLEVWGYFGYLNQPNGNYEYIAMLENSNAAVCSLSRFHNSDNRFYNYDGVAARMGPVISGGYWTYLTLGMTDAGDYSIFYVNGTLQTIQASTSARNSDGTLVFGRYDPGSTHYLLGNITEGRVSNILRSDDWINQSYQLHENQATYIGFGSEENADQTPPDITLNTPTNNTNTSSQTIEFNFTATENTAGTINCSLYMDNVFQVENATTANNTLTNLTATSITEGPHNWSVNCTDAAANQNQSEQRTFYIDLTPPTASSISYTPGSEDNIDPSTTIEINATITDNRVLVDTVILQYHNGTTWINTTMINSTASVYNVTITTLPADANYTFNIWKNDSFGNANSSTNQTFNSTYDCTWTATSDLGAVTGWDENKWVGNISINNTGDAAFATSNCSLDFRLTYDLTEGRIYYDSSYLKPSNTYTVTAKDNLTITINSTFLSEVKQENAIITLTDSYSRSSTSSRNTTLTLVSNQAGPYLYQLITSPTSALSIDLTPQNITLNAYLRNLMGSTTVNENNTAYNITFNWTLPTNFLIKEGNGTLSYGNISNNNLNYNYINITFNATNLPSLSAGTQTIYLYASGVNISGDIITNADNVSLLNEQLNITFSCYNTSDGIYVTDCGELDGDYVAPVAAGTGGGSGGGSGGATAQTVRTSADFQLIRGEENKVKVSFKNTEENQTIKDIKFSVEGKIAKYIKIVPETLAELNPGEEIDIIFEITSPTYIDLGKQEIIITLEGKKGSLKYINAKKITLEIHELSGNKAHELLNKSAELIQQLNQANLSYPYLDEILNQSLQEITSFNYEIVRDNYKIIEEQVNNALKTKNIIEELTGLLETAKAKGINTDYSERLIKLASLSLERREFSQAYARAKDSQSVYALEVKGEFGKISYYLKNYPEQISFGFLFLALFSFSTYKVGRLQVIKRKIKKLQQEEILLNQLMTAVQEDCFKKNKMSMDEYKTAMEQYQDKLSKVIEKLIELENQRIHALKFTSKNKKLKRERENIIKLITELQDDYLKKKKIETRSYELKLLSYNKRLGEIDEMIAMLEAKKAFKRGLKFWKSPKVPKRGKLK